MKRHQWIVWLILVGLMLLVVTRFASLHNLYKQLSQAKWQWLVVAGAVHAAFFLGYAYLYQVGFRIVEVNLAFRQAVPLLFDSLFANAVAPAGGAAGSAIFVEELAQEDKEGGRVAIGTALVLLLDLGTLLPFVAYGLWFLYAKNYLRFYDYIGASFFLIFLLGMTVALILAANKPDTLRKVLRWIGRTINAIAAKFKHPDLIGDDWADRNTGTIQDASSAIGEHPKLLAYGLAIGLVLHAVNAAGLYAIFPAVQQQTSLGALIAAFGMGIIFYVVAIIPQGLAAVEGIMGLVFVLAGVPGAKAAAIVVIYRGFSYWAPLIIGFFSIRSTKFWQGGRSKDEHKKGKGKDEKKEKEPGPGRDSRLGRWNGHDRGQSPSDRTAQGPRRGDADQN